MSLKINGKSYDWGDVDVKLPGLNLVVQEISYDDELEKEAVYGKGQMPRGYGEGNYKSQAKISVLRDDFDELLDYCKSKKTALYKLVIPKIIVSYADDGGKTKTDVLNTVTISKVSHKVGQGDKTLKVDIDLLVVKGIERDDVQAI